MQLKFSRAGELRFTGRFNPLTGEITVPVKSGQAPPPVAPLSPSNIRTPDPNLDGRAVVAWDAALGADFYRVYRDGVLAATDILATSWPDEGLTNGVDYVYNVSAVNAGGESDLVPESAVTDTPMWAIVNLVVTERRTTSFVFDWDAHDPEAPIFNAQRMDSMAESNVAKPFDTLTYFSGINDNSQYTFRVRSIKGGPTRYGPWASITEYTAPLKPAGFAVFEVSGGVTLEWDTSAGVTWNVFRGTDPGSLTGIVAGITLLTYTDTTGDPGVLYYYAVQAEGIASGFPSESTDPLSATKLALPYNTVAPVATSGGENPANFADTLSVTEGTWTAYPAVMAYTYQWYNSLGPISGATFSIYVVQHEDQPGEISCMVTATNSQGSQGAYSNVITINSPPEDP